MAPLRAALAAPQTRLLRRTFFTRLFESELMPEGLPQFQLMLWSILLAATPTTGYPLILADKYAAAQFVLPLAAEFDADRVLLVTLSMVAMGVVSLIIWDGVFPDRRDVRILGVLPVPIQRLIAARFAALAQVFVLFATAICVLQSFIFAMVVAGYGDPVWRYHGFAAHLVTAFAACTFVFCALVAAQCLLLLLFGRRTAQAASMSFQVLFAVGLVQLLVFLEPIGRALRSGGSANEGLTGLVALPPAWFFGIYETLTGTSDPAAATLARIGVSATLASAALAITLYAVSYSRLSRRALEGPVPHRTRLRVWPTFARLARPGRGFGSPMRTAIRQFAGRTLVRSRSHRMMFAVYGGVALAIVLSSAASAGMRHGGADVRQPGIALLSMPLVFQFLLLVALRVILAVPAEPKARWVFRACEPTDRGEAVSAIRDTMIATVVVPTVLFALAQGLVFWTVPAALGHAAFCFALGLLLAEILIARTNKLPFACTYFPGKSRVFTLWPVYLLVFFFYTLFLAAVEQAFLLESPGRLMIFCGLAVSAAASLAWYRRRALAAMPGLLFEEEDPGALFEGFHLSEGLASAPKLAQHGGVPGPPAVVPGGSTNGL